MKTNRFWGATLLIMGTTVGAGMLAIPSTIGLAGLGLSIVLMSFIWLYMMLTAYYLLEVNLRLPGETNMITMMHKTLGRPGEIVAWIIYLFLLYSLTAAYILGCGEILSHLLSHYMVLSGYVWSSLVVCLFSFFLYFGTRSVDYLNRFCIVGLAAGYMGLLVLGFPYVKGEFYLHASFSPFVSAIPVVVTSFGYHIIIPTLTTYLDHDVKLLRQAIFVGSLLAFLIYLFWLLLAVGVIPPYGKDSLAEARASGLPTTIYLQAIIQSKWMTTSAHAFSLFAIITSLLGVSLSLTDFLADGLHIEKKGWKKAGLIFLTFAPPLVFAFAYPHGFILALQYAGIFVLILLAILPALMVYFERYVKEKDFL